MMLRPSNLSSTIFVFFFQRKLTFDSRNYCQYLCCFISESQIKSPEEISLDGFEQVYVSHCDSGFSSLHFQFEV